VTVTATSSGVQLSPDRDPHSNVARTIALGPVHRPRRQSAPVVGRPTRYGSRARLSPRSPSRPPPHAQRRSDGASVNRARHYSDLFLRQSEPRASRGRPPVDRRNLSRRWPPLQGLVPPPCLQVCRRCTSNTLARLIGAAQLRDVSDSRGHLVIRTPGTPLMPTVTGLQLRALTRYSDGALVDLTSQATWSTSAPGVATVLDAAGANGMALRSRRRSTAGPAPLGAVRPRRRSLSSGGQARPRFRWRRPLTCGPGGQTLSYGAQGLYKRRVHGSNLTTKPSVTTGNSAV